MHIERLFRHLDALGVGTLLPLFCLTLFLVLHWDCRRNSSSRPEDILHHYTQIHSSMPIAILSMPKPSDAASNAFLSNLLHLGTCATERSDGLLRTWVILVSHQSLTSILSYNCIVVFSDPGESGVWDFQQVMASIFLEDDQDEYILIHFLLFLHFKTTLITKTLPETFVRSIPCTALFMLEKMQVPEVVNKSHFIHIY